MFGSKQTPILDRFALPELEALSFRQQSKFRDEKLTIKEDNGSNARDAQIREIEGNYFLTSNVQYGPRIQPTNATVLISPSKEATAHGTGVIVNYKDRTFVVTATHVIEEAAYGKESDLAVYVPIGNTPIKIPLKDTPMLYSSIIARQNGWPIGDVAIFDFNKPFPGVRIADTLRKDEAAFTIGYPGRHASAWLNTLTPLVSFGFANMPDRAPPNAYVTKLLAEHAHKEGKEVPDERSLNKILFSGVSAGGNSGGGLFNDKGEILGVCRGPQGTIGRETGLEEFYPIKEIFEVILKGDNNP